MSTTKQKQNQTTTAPNLINSIGVGLLAGLVGGLVFGIMMQLMDMLPMVAMMVGSESLALAWAIHLGISAFIGATFGVLAGRAFSSLSISLAAGLGYGAVWWVLGALVMMPAKMGMPIFVINEMAIKSLVGHLIFGLVMGGVAFVLAANRANRA